MKVGPGSHHSGAKRMAARPAWRTRMRRIAIMGGGLCCLVLACNSTPPQDLGSVHVKSGEFQAGHSGRLEVTATDHAGLTGVSIDIPEGALKANAKITIDEVMASIIPDDSLPKGPAADFGPEGLTFAKPVRITLPFQGTLE